MSQKSSDMVSYRDAFVSACNASGRVGLLKDMITRSSRVAVVGGKGIECQVRCDVGVGIPPISSEKVSTPQPAADAIDERTTWDL